MRRFVIAAALSAIASIGGPTRDACARSPVVVVLEGLPQDSTAAAAFQEGFRKAFGVGTLEPARRRGRTTLPIPNGFRLLEVAAGSEPADAWRAQMSLEWPAPPRRARTPVAPSRARVRCTWYALSPQSVAGGARVMPRQEQLTFADGTPPVEMGRLVAVLLLETLHQFDGALPGERRLFLGATRRQPL